MPVPVPVPVLLAPLALLALLTGCAGTSAASSAPTVTIIERERVTATVTETVTATETAVVTVAPTTTVRNPAGPVPTAALPTFELTVLEDGCAVQRSEGDADGLTWSVRDHLGVQVLGRNALGETRYRYFVPGTWTVVLEAWAGDRYAPVSAEVTITC